MIDLLLSLGVVLLGIALYVGTALALGWVAVVLVVSALIALFIGAVFALLRVIRGGA